MIDASETKPDIRQHQLERDIHEYLEAGGEIDTLPPVPESVPSRIVRYNAVWEGRSYE